MNPKDKNFTLTSSELSLLRDRSFFDQKRLLSDRIAIMLGALTESYRNEIIKYESFVPAEARMKTGKISKGENYLGLPYQVLDFPAVFTKDNVFALRTMIWWANPAIITFHVAGKYLSLFDVENPEFLKLLPDDYLVCINSDQWVHHIQPSNFITVGEYMKNEKGDYPSFFKNDFFKLACIVPLEQIHLLESRSLAFLNAVLGLAKS
jgi:hypothetical protein